MQVLTNLFMVLKSVVIAIGRLVYLLLVKLYLVIPVIYILALWIASATVPFALADYGVFIVIGMALCVALSILLVLRHALLAPLSKRAQGRRSSVISTGDMDTKPMYAEPSPVPQPSPMVAPFLDEEPEYYEDKQELEHLRQKRSAETQKKEKPIYYRTKRDPSLYIAEYPEYLEFYRKTGERYVFLAKEVKE